MKTTINPATGITAMKVMPADRNSLVKAAELCGEIRKVRDANDRIMPHIGPYVPTNEELLATHTTLCRVLSEASGWAEPPKEEPSDDADGKGEADAET